MSAVRRLVFKLQGVGGLRRATGLRPSGQAIKRIQEFAQPLPFPADIIVNLTPAWGNAVTSGGRRRANRRDFAPGGKAFSRAGSGVDYMTTERQASVTAEGCARRLRAMRPSLLSPQP